MSSIEDSGDLRDAVPLIGMSVPLFLGGVFKSLKFPTYGYKNRGVRGVDSCKSLIFVT